VTNGRFISVERLLGEIGLRAQVPEIFAEVRAILLAEETLKRAA
jgi:hypothetical protein